MLRNKVAPIRFRQSETQPLSAEQLASLGWQEREGLITPHYTMESHRLTAHDTLLLTVKQLGYAYGSKTPNVPDHAAYAALSRVLRERFRSLCRACHSALLERVYQRGLRLPPRGRGDRGQAEHLLYGGMFRAWPCHSIAHGALFAERIGGGEPPLAALETQDAIHATRATSMVRHKDGLCGRQATGCMDRQESAQRQSLERLITMRELMGYARTPCTVD